MKTTSKAKKGLRKSINEINITELLNIYDFTVSMSMEIDEFFIDYKEK